jgi:hypothetical protein
MIRIASMGKTKSDKDIQQGISVDFTSLFASPTARVHRAYLLSSPLNFPFLSSSTSSPITSCQTLRGCVVIDNRLILHRLDIYPNNDMPSLR